MCARLEQAGARMQALAERRWALVAVALQQWAKSEHDWQNRSGATEQSIVAFVSEASAQTVTITLQATSQAAIFLELAREGRWAWLWKVLTGHEVDIIAILNGSDPPGLDIKSNPDLQAQYEAAKAAIREARQSDRARTG